MKPDTNEIATVLTTMPVGAVTVIRGVRVARHSGELFELGGGPGLDKLVEAIVNLADTECVAWMVKRQVTDISDRPLGVAIGQAHEIAQRHQTTVIVGRLRARGRSSRHFLWGERTEARTDARELDGGAWWEPVAIVRHDRSEAELIG